MVDRKEWGQNDQAGAPRCRQPAASSDRRARTVPLAAVHPVGVPINIEVVSTLDAPTEVVWDRVVRVSGANKELWPFARMTRPAFEDRLTSPEPGKLPPFRTWFLLFGLIPIARRTMELEVLEEGRFVESSSSWITGRQRHERLATTGAPGSTLLIDRLTIESQNRTIDAVMRAGVTTTFRLRHRRLRRHFRAATR